MGLRVGVALDCNRLVLQLGMQILGIYTSRHKYFIETKVKYTHNLKLLHIQFGINGTVV